MDKILATLAIAVLLGFIGILLWFVAKPNLIIITVLVLCLAVYDFWRQMYRDGREG
jgi:fatty acid desaturase